MNTPRSRLRPLLASALGLLFAGTDSASAAVPIVHLELVTDQVESPTSITHSGDDRLFLTEQSGLVRVLVNGVLRVEPYLDLSDRVGSGPVKGLLNVLFHPAFASNGRLFVTYTDPAGDVVLSRFTGTADFGDPDSERVLLRVPQPVGNHNGGQLAFGPDGMLYLATGDGGGVHDPFCSSQDASTLLGKMLRIDVDSGTASPPYYSIPPDNPFVGPGDPRDEVWALGLRNPWRFSFDRQTGELYLPDVGEDLREEVNLEPAGFAGGRNYGWKVVEGTVCRNDDACDPAPPACNSAAYTPPIFEYDHSQGDCSITGGAAYRGRSIPGLTGAYVYGDFCTGNLWAARRTATSWSSERLAATLPGVQTFGEGGDGELYLADFGNLYRLAGTGGTCAPGEEALCLAAGRFRVTATWRTPAGATGNARAVPLASDTGAFWFFEPTNFEMLVKVLDACDFNGRFWVFAGGLTNVEVRMTVTDTATGAVREYSNPLNQPFQPIQATNAFATCP